MPSRVPTLAAVICAHPSTGVLLGGNGGEEAFRHPLPQEMSFSDRILPGYKQHFPEMRFRLVRFLSFSALPEFPDAIRDVHLEVLWRLIYKFLGFHHIFRGQNPNVDVLGATVRPDNAE